MSIRICNNDDGGIAEWTEIQTIRATFKNFNSFPTQPGFMIDSPAMTAHGLPWSIWVYPSGVEGDELQIQNAISVYLHCAGGTTAEAAATHVKFKLRTEVRTSSRIEPIASFVDGIACGCHKFLPRDDDMLETILVNGALVIHADIQIPAAATPAIWVPKNECTPLTKDMIKLLKSANETGDVKFVVDGREFSAHRHILGVRSPALCELVDAIREDNTDTSSPIPIDNVGRDEFTVLLRYVYANEIPSWATAADEADGPCPRATLELADKFGCTGLKLAAEAELADKHITSESCSDVMLFADCMNCALLKETAVQYFAENIDDVMASDGWNRLQESAAILSEMMEIGFGKGKPVDDETADGDYRRMRVSTLRRELEKRGLDVDGSKEIMANRLEQSDAQVNHLFGVVGAHDDDDDDDDNDDADY